MIITLIPFSLAFYFFTTVNFEQYETKILFLLSPSLSIYMLEYSIKDYFQRTYDNMEMVP